MRKFAALALVLALTGCSAQEPAPTVTPVDLKYCALSDSAGFNDDGLNRSVYAALQQLKVQTGAAVMAIEVSAKLTPAAGIAKLIESNCDAIITAGEELAPATAAAAKKNDTIRFVSVGDTSKFDEQSPNFVSLTFDIYQAAYAAGYLAAETATKTTDVAILDLLRNAETKKSIKAFTAGVARFNTLNRSRVKVSRVTAITNATQDVAFVLAGNGSILGEIDPANSIKLIGYGRDWYVDAKNSNLKSRILTSVVRIGVIDKVVATIAASAGSQNFDLSSEQVGLAPENEIAFPRDFAAALEAIIKDLTDGKVKVG